MLYIGKQIAWPLILVKKCSKNVFKGVLPAINAVKTFEKVFLVVQTTGQNNLDFIIWTILMVSGLCNPNFYNIGAN